MPDYSKQILKQCEDGLLFEKFCGIPRKLTKSDKFKLFLNKHLFCRFDVQLYKPKPLPGNKGDTINFRRYSELKPSIKPLLEGCLATPSNIALINWCDDHNIKRRALLTNKKGYLYLTINWQNFKIKESQDGR